MYETREIPTTGLLSQHAHLLRTCFPRARKFNENYLDWLYRGNPNGPAIGFDSYKDGELVAHFAAVPGLATTRTKTIKTLVSVNTCANHNYPGDHFTRLGLRTIRRAKDRGFDLVYGITNKISSPLFTSLLGFQNFGPLRVEIVFPAFSRKSHSTLNNAPGFERVRNSQELKWRTANPANPLILKKYRDAIVAVGRTGLGSFLPVISRPLRLSQGFEAPLREFSNPFALNIFRGQTDFGKRGFKIPDWAKPSPLNFVVLVLNPNIKVEFETLAVDFLDFDAY